MTAGDWGLVGSRCVGDSRVDCHVRSRSVTGAKILNRPPATIAPLASLGQAMSLRFLSDEVVTLHCVIREVMRAPTCERNKSGVDSRVDRFRNDEWVCKSPQKR